MRKVDADAIREHVRSKYITPARQRGSAVVEIVAGQVLKELGLRGDRAPAVCSALNTQEFSRDNHLVLEKREGPPSKQSTTVKFTFRLLDEQPAPAPLGEDPFLKLYGIAKEVFESLGGGEEFLRKEREQFYGPGKEL